MRGPRNKELRVGRTCGSGGCQVPKLSIDPHLGRGRVAPGSARRRRLRLLQAEGLGARSAGRGHGAAQAAAGRAGRASRGGEYARRRVCERAGGAAPARSRPLMQLRHRFQGSCNPIPSDSQALSDSSDLVHPREGGERERKKAPTVCPSWHPIDFLEEGPIPAWRPARVEEPPTPAQCSPRYSHGGKVVPRFYCPSLALPLPPLLFLLLLPALLLPQVLTDVAGLSPHPRAPSSSAPAPALALSPFFLPLSSAVGTLRAAGRLPPQGAKLGKLGVQLALLLLSGSFQAAPGPRARSGSQLRSGRCCRGGGAARAEVGDWGEPGRREPRACSLPPPPPPPLSGPHADTFMPAPPLPPP